MTPDEEVSRVVRRSALAAAALGAVLSPVPFADEVALVPLHGWMTVRVARARGVAPSSLPLASLTKTVVVGLAARAAVNAAFAFIPGVAAVTNATSAAALTTIYGELVDRVCREPGVSATVGLREMMTALRSRVRVGARTA